MAIKILRPSVGVIQVAPQDTYEGTLFRYASDIRTALREMENAEIKTRLDAFEQGDMSFSSLETYLKGILSKYPKDTARYVQIQEAISNARTADIRLSDRRILNELTEQYGSGGLSQSELTTMYQRRIANLRAKNAEKYDPETWGSVLKEYATFQDEIRTAGIAASKEKTATEVSRLEVQLDDAYAKYSDPTHPSPITGRDYYRVANDILTDLDRLGALSSEARQGWNQLKMVQRLRDQGQIADVLTPDKMGFETYQAVPTASLAARYQVASSTDAEGKAVWKVVDAFSGEKAAGTADYKDEAVAMGVAEGKNAAPFTYKSATNEQKTASWDQYAGEAGMFKEIAVDTGEVRYFADINNPQYLSEAEVRPAEPPKEGFLRGAAREVGELARKEPTLAALGAVGVAKVAPKVAPLVAKVVRAGIPVAGRLAGAALKAAGGIPKFTGVGTIGAVAGLGALGVGEILSAAEIMRRIKEARTTAEAEAAISEGAIFSPFAWGAKAGQALIKKTEPELAGRRYGEAAPRGVSLLGRAVGGLQAFTERMFAGTPLFRRR